MLTSQLHTAHILFAYPALEQKNKAIQDLKEQKNRCVLRTVSSSCIRPSHPLFALALPKILFKSASCHLGLRASSFGY